MELSKYKKKKIYHFLMYLAFFLLIVSLVGCSGNKTANSGTSTDGESEGASTNTSGIEEMTIMLGGVTPEGHPLTLGGEKFKEIVESKTDGKVKVDFYPNNQLGSIREQTEQTQIGSLNMTQTLLSTVSSFDETLQVFEYPFLWPTDEEEIWSVLSGEVGDLALSGMEKAQLKGFGFWAGGFKAITTKDKPVMNPGDLKGVNMRVIPSEILQKTYEAYGANPIPIEFAELYNALQQGVVDAQENPLETIYSTKYYEVQEYLTLTDHGYQFYMIVANLDWFNTLNPELQKIIIEAEEEARIYARDMTREMADKRIEEFPDLGLEVHRLDDSGRSDFEKLSLPLHEEFSNTPEKQELLQKIYDELGK